MTRVSYETIFRGRIGSATWAWTHGFHPVAVGHEARCGFSGSAHAPMRFMQVSSRKFAVGSPAAQGDVRTRQGRAHPRYLAPSSRAIQCTMRCRGYIASCGVPVVLGPASPRQTMRRTPSLARRSRSAERITTPLPSVWPRTRTRRRAGPGYRSVHADPPRAGGCHRRPRAARQYERAAARASGPGPRSARQFSLAELTAASFANDVR